LSDRLLVLESAELRVLVCTSREAALEASRRHRLAEGSAGALAQAMTGALLLAAHDGIRVDLQLDCTGPLRGLLVDAEPDGAVRGLSRVNDLDRQGLRGGPSRSERERFDARAVLASRHDEEAGRLSILRAEPGSASPQRAAFPFAGGDLGAALTLFLRSDREAGGEVALEALLEDGLSEAAGVLVAPLSPEFDASPLGKPLRQGRVRDALLSTSDALALAEALFDGPLRLLREITPRFACRCSKERVARALKTLGAAELRDMAEKDGGAEITCDFCAEKYALSSEELLSLLA
jgi:molecular chaperone Hsp33